MRRSIRADTSRPSDEPLNSVCTRWRVSSTGITWAPTGSHMRVTMPRVTFWARGDSRRSRAWVR